MKQAATQGAAQLVGQKGVSAEVLMATPCTNSLGGEGGGQKHEGCGGRSACSKYAAVSGA